MSTTLLSIGFSSVLTCILLPIFFEYTGRNKLVCRAAFRKPRIKINTVLYLIKIGFLPVFAIMDHAPKGIPPFGLPIWK